MTVLTVSQFPYNLVTPYLKALILFKKHFVICRSDSPEETNEIPPSIQNKSSENDSGPQPDSDLDR